MRAAYELQARVTLMAQTHHCEVHLMQANPASNQVHKGCNIGTTQDYNHWTDLLLPLLMPIAAPRSPHHPNTPAASGRQHRHVRIRILVAAAAACRVSVIASLSRTRRRQHQQLL